MEPLKRHIVLKATCFLGGVALLVGGGGQWLWEIHEPDGSNPTPTGCWSVFLGVSMIAISLMWTFGRTQYPDPPRGFDVVPRNPSEKNDSHPR